MGRNSSPAGDAQLGKALGRALPQVVAHAERLQASADPRHQAALYGMGALMAAVEAELARLQGRPADSAETVLERLFARLTALPEAEPIPVPETPNPQDDDPAAPAPEHVLRFVPDAMTALRTVMELRSRGHNVRLYPHRLGQGYAIYRVRE